MKTNLTVAELLSWRLTQAELDAPPAPRAARLLELARPWWEVWPEKFQAVVRQLGAVQTRYGHAMVEAALVPIGRTVPVVVIDANDERETSVQVLYLDVGESSLQLRIEADADHRSFGSAFECTFISEATLKPLFWAPARLSVGSEYRIDAFLPEALGEEWKNLKVTDPMPFRLIFRLDAPRR